MGVDFEVLFKKFENGEIENEKVKIIYKISMECFEIFEFLEIV